MVRADFENAEGTCGLRGLSELFKVLWELISWLTVVDQNQE